MRRGRAKSSYRSLDIMTVHRQVMGEEPDETSVGVSSGPRLAFPSRSDEGHRRDPPEDVQQIHHLRPCRFHMRLLACRHRFGHNIADTRPSPSHFVQWLPTRQKPKDGEAFGRIHRLQRLSLVTMTTYRHAQRSQLASFLTFPV